MQCNCWSTNAQPTLADPVDWRPTKTHLTQTAVNHGICKVFAEADTLSESKAFSRKHDYLHIVANFCNCSGFESLTTTDEKFKRLRRSSFAVAGYARFFKSTQSSTEFQKGISIVKNRLMMRLIVGFSNFFDSPINR